MVEVHVASLGVDAGNKSPVVILKETGGERVLPIWIGPAEASAIAMEMAGMKFERPLTHDLLASLLRALGATLERVEISRVEKNTYYARMVLSLGEQRIPVDARPSDSIAVALRTGSRILADAQLLSDSPEEGSPPPGSPTPGEPEAGGSSGLSAEQLRDYLRKMNPEDLGRFNP